MKILFVAARWDPKNPDSGAGVNFNAYTALRNLGHEIIIGGPFSSELSFLERLAKKSVETFTSRKLIKFYPSFIKRSNPAIQKLINDYQPDVVFSKSSIPLLNVELSVPFVYLCDSSVKWVKDNWPYYTRPGFYIMEKWERKVINKADHIITFSDANASVLNSYYQKPKDQISVHPIPSALPTELGGYERKDFGGDNTLNLVLVGKKYERKGVDIAIKTVEALNNIGIKTKLRIVGQEGPSDEFTTFMGLYLKKDPEQLLSYVANYQWAHLQIFPSRFDPAGIVPAEAAQFGVPTITNASGGLATTVKDNVSGIVLEKDSPAEEYIKAIETLWQNPQKYDQLSRSTFTRYQSELNWDSFGKYINELLEKAVQNHHRRL